MKKLLGIVIIFFLYSNISLALELPKDVVSGNKYEKSLTGSYYKKYGMQIVSKKKDIPLGQVNNR